MQQVTHLGRKYKVVFKEGKLSWHIHRTRKATDYASNGKRKSATGIKKKKVTKCYLLGDLMVILQV